jgi:hypothetical protein
LENLPTLEQVPTTPPPLFGRNEAAVPPTGGIEQPLTTTLPPLFGRNIPRNDIIPDTGIAEQPETQQPEEEPSNEGQEIAGPLA